MAALHNDLPCTVRSSLESFLDWSWFYLEMDEWIRYTFFTYSCGAWLSAQVVAQGLWDRIFAIFNLKPCSLGCVMWSYRARRESSMVSLLSTLYLIISKFCVWRYVVEVNLLARGIRYGRRSTSRRYISRREFVHVIRSTITRYFFTRLTFDRYW